MLPVGILLSFSAQAESLAGYYLRFVRNEGVFASLVSLVYVFCGLLSFYNLVLAFQKFAEGDHHAGTQARTWCLSLLLIAVLTFFVSTLTEDSRTMATVNLGSALGKTHAGLNGTFTVISRLVYVTCGIVALMVLPGKFRAMQEGDRYAGRSITNWGLGLISAVSIVYVIHNFFFQ